MRFWYVLLAVVVACGGRPASDGTHVAAGYSTAGYRQASSVYLVLIDFLGARAAPDTLLVADSTLSFSLPPSAPPYHWRAEWRAQFDSLPRGLADALHSISRDKQPSTDLPLPRPVQLITRATLQEIFGGGTRGGWEEFYRRYPRQRNYLQFSPVAFTKDSLDALVYYEYHCHALCGGGNAVWLTRREGNRWRVRKVLQFWVS